MLSEYIGALFMIFVAEMGDKTQVLAMMFATKYKTSKVLLGIFIGSFLNHGLAVIFGRFIGGIINPNILQVIAGVAFIGFAFWTLLAKGDDEDDEINTSKGAIITVALAFFVGELGDKTQLTAITLSMDATFPFLVLLGTVSGMIVTSSLGIFVGSKVGDKIPELVIKLASSAIFLVFGVLKLIGSTPDQWVTIYTVIPLLLVIITGVSILTNQLIKGYVSGELTPLRHAAKQLYDIHHMNTLLVEDLCRTVNHCGQCQGTSCGIGIIKHILQDIQDNEFDDDHLELIEKLKMVEDKFSQDKLIHMLESNLEFLYSYKLKDDKYKEVDNIRKAAEILLFGSKTDLPETIEDYINQLTNINETIAIKLNYKITKKI